MSKIVLRDGPGVKVEGELPIGGGRAIKLNGLWAVVSLQETTEEIPAGTFGHQATAYIHGLTETRMELIHLHGQLEAVPDNNIARRNALAAMLAQPDEEVNKTLAALIHLGEAAARANREVEADVEIGEDGRPKFTVRLVPKT